MDHYRQLFQRENRNTSLTNNKTLKYKYASPAWDFGPLFRPTSESAPDARAPPSYPNRSQLPQPLRSHSLRPYFIRTTLQKARRHRHTIVRVLAGRGRLGATYLAAPSVPPTFSTRRTSHRRASTAPAAFWWYSSTLVYGSMVSRCLPDKVAARTTYSSVINGVDRSLKRHGPMSALLPGSSTNGPTRSS